MRHVFFLPRVAPAYQQGWGGLRTLIVGMGVPCTGLYKTSQWEQPQPCPLADACTSDSRKTDQRCPHYSSRPHDEWTPYYRLSNENTIAIDDFLDNPTLNKSSSLTLLTHTLLATDHPTREQRRGLWESVAFYNYHQQIALCGSGLPAWDVALFTQADYAAFCEVLEALKPQQVLAWQREVRDVLTAHSHPWLSAPDRLHGGRCEVFRFLVSGEALPSDADSETSPLVSAEVDRRIRRLVAAGLLIVTNDGRYQISTSATFTYPIQQTLQGRSLPTVERTVKGKTAITGAVCLYLTIDTSLQQRQLPLLLNIKGNPRDHIKYLRQKCGYRPTPTATVHDWDQQWSSTFDELLGLSI